MCCFLSRIIKHNAVNATTRPAQTHTHVHILLPYIHENFTRFYVFGILSFTDRHSSTEK